MTDGSAPQKLCLIEHSDGAVWLILCITNIIEISGNKELYNRVVPYCDGSEATVLEHMKQAARYSKQQLNTVCVLCLTVTGQIR